MIQAVLNYLLQDTSINILHLDPSVTYQITVTPEISHGSETKRGLPAETKATVYAEGNNYSST